MRIFLPLRPARFSASPVHFGSFFCLVYVFAHLLFFRLVLFTCFGIFSFFGIFFRLFTLFRFSGIFFFLLDSVAIFWYFLRFLYFFCYPIYQYRGPGAARQVAQKARSNKKLSMLTGKMDHKSKTTEISLICVLFAQQHTWRWTGKRSFTCCLLRRFYAKIPGNTHFYTNEVIST